QSFTFSVRVLLPREAIAPDSGDNVGNLLKPGMFARVSVIRGPPRRILTVPESSLVNKKDREGTVFVIKGGAVFEREVRFGDSLGEDREIGSGLVPGEVVVLSPDSGLRDGVYVSVE
ncbi:MAG: hypothetical protein LBP32_03505, partial [Spirochaetaceae bacterium]|nr:hypothetical protein [Spirochaetaceae bacterium]